MMNLPSLPTDNLYKFLALSGLAIVLFSLVFPIIQISEIRLKIIEIETQMEVLEMDTGNVENDLIEALVNKGNLSPQEKGQFRNYLIELFKKNAVKDWNEQSEPILRPEEQAPFRSRLNELRKKIAELKGQRRKFILLFSELRNYRWMLFIGGSLGIVMSSLGFCLWYLIVQKPNDILLRKQVQNYKS